MDAVLTASFESHDGGCTGWAVAASTVSKKICSWQACRDISPTFILPSCMCMFSLKRTSLSLA